ncbi:protein SMG7-like [Aricia agestis]|uniref:protein SMG7-like n=1 Tax=Aricia agestis TaxID=91739 RepID=UPI001C202DA0|nr:protein SMG7-like [Aricia agestis]
MVLNAAVQVLREADDLKQKISKFNNGTSMLQDKTLWTNQQELQKVYQKVLMLDLDYALEKKVEQDLWNIGFKQQIEALQAITKDRKNPLRSEAQSMLSWVLQAAAGFYLCLLHQICSTFKLDLPFRRRASLLGAVGGWEGGGVEGAGAARYACQHCLVHLGDLARYRQQLRIAHTFYRHALAVSVHSGQPYNQLALVSWRRGRRLAAVYWHVRSLLVRAPFPPAPANLARTLQAAASRDVKESALPVLPGLSGKPLAASGAPERLDSHTYVNELLRALHYLHTAEQLDAAAELVKSLNTSLSPLIATDSFDSLTLIKMTCVIIWMVHSAREGWSVPLSALSGGEARAAALAAELAAGALLALLLPAYTTALPARAQPALKVWVSWLAYCDEGAAALCGARPQLWGALAHALNTLAPAAALATPDYDCVPLPEDEELHGFLPLEAALAPLTFTAQSGHDGGAFPEYDTDTDSGAGVSALSLVGEPELEGRVRARRLQRLARCLAGRHAQHIAVTTAEDGTPEWSATTLGGAQLAEALEPLLAEHATESAPDSAPDRERTPPPPLIISEADFREKVKRVGILKPQGSLERAREERATATQSEPDQEDECSKSEDKKEARKPRVNIAMAAIMRKQEETNKQVKFVTPPPTPDSATELQDTAKDDKLKVIQPKPIKSLANIPIGRKTGGILSLKDKSAGYPHLVNADEPKKPEKEEKKENKSSQGGPSSQTYQKPWPAGEPRFQKTYGVQAAYSPAGQPYGPAGQGYNPGGQSYGSVGPAYGSGGPAFGPGQGAAIRLPVVNPKEIDVRSAALQKRRDPDRPLSGDKRNFLADLPPRFANQYRHWQAEPDDPPPQPPPPQPWPAQHQRPWTVPAQESFAAPAYPPMSVPNYYQMNVNPYQNTFTQMQNQVSSAQKTEGGYLQGGGGLAALRGLAAPAGYGFAPPAGYDAAMYPQFNTYPLLGMDKPKELDVGFGANVLDVQRNFSEYQERKPEESEQKQMGLSEGGAGARGNAEYSLFSAAPAAAWSRPLPHQSLWSGPGPSPLERLLEQQKQMKQPPPPQ